MSEFANVLAEVLAALFAAVAALNLVPPQLLPHAYQRRQRARGFDYIASFTQALTALCLVVPQTRIWGGMLGATVLFITIVSLLNHGKYICAVPAILVMLALAPAMI